MTRSYERLATKTFSTMRPPAMSGGQRGDPVTYLTDVKGIPLYPADEELLARDNIETFFEVKETYVIGDIDIREGDFLVDGSEEYRVRGVGEYEWIDGTAFKRVICEEDKPDAIS